MSQNRQAKKREKLKKNIDPNFGRARKGVQDCYNHMKRILIIGFCAGLLSLNPVSAEVKSGSIQQSLAGVPASELPAKAAQLVQAATVSDREAVTVAVVKAAVAQRPAAASAIVGAVAKDNPGVAATAAGTAATAQPKLARAIAKSAATAAPSKAGEIVVAVCKAAPKEYREVAVAVAQGAPGSEKEILRALAVAFPNLKPGIEEAINAYAANPASFATVVSSLKPVTVAASTSPDVARGPTIAPPYVPPSGTPASVTPSTSGQVPTGGRDYAKP